MGESFRNDVSQMRLETLDNVCFFIDLLIEVNL